MTNSSISLTGKILYLTSSSSLLEQQIQAEASVEELGQSIKDISFHYGVNTDAMISGKACTFGYTPEILGPYFLENFQEVIHCGDVQQGGFQIIVGGDAYGTGSSRSSRCCAPVLASNWLLHPSAYFSREYGLCRASFYF